MLSRVRIFSTVQLSEDAIDSFIDSLHFNEDSLLSVKPCVAQVSVVSGERQVTRVCRATVCVGVQRVTKIGNATLFCSPLGEIEA